MKLETLFRTYHVTTITLKKLKNLVLAEVSPVDVLHNLSSRILTEAESKLLNKRLDLSLYSSRLDVQHIRAEFEIFIQNYVIYYQRHNA